MSPICLRRPAIRRHTSGAALLALVVALGACESSPTAPGIGPEPLLQTGAGEYAFEPSPAGGQELAVPYTFTNRTAEAVSIGNCNGVFSHGLERLTSQGWQRSWSATVLLCHSEPIQIAPGDSWNGKLVVRAVPPTAVSGAELTLADDLNGTYRLVWDMPVTRGAGGEQVLAKDLRVSNSFQVRLP